MGRGKFTEKAKGLERPQPRFAKKLVATLVASYSAMVVADLAGRPSVIGKNEQF